METTRDTVSQTPREGDSESSLIHTEDLSKSYGETHAVRNVTFSIGKGEVVGLLGPNGAGKTTLMKILTCFHFPDFGSASGGGYDIYDHPHEIKGMIGFLPENAPLYTELNVFEYLEFITDARKVDPLRKGDYMDRAIDVCGLNGVVYKPIDQLSKGFKQRVGLAQAIIHNPRVLILDEPTTGLDPNQIIEIRKLIQELEKEKTVILSTHILREVEAVCQRVMIMNRGGIIASGTPNEISDQMRGGAQVSVRLKGRGFNRFTDELKKDDRIDRVEEQSSDDDVREYHIGAGDKDIACELIFDTAVAQGFKLLEMKAVEMSLEDIFIELTGKEGQ
jgi:ABC-2 type transport system ATP-binding protein